jgi:histidinol phosphatase-like enzyme (inositol monophosphatase family)
MGSSRATHLRVALAAAHRAGAIAMRAFGTRLTIETKADATPVTVIDRACEEAMRKTITRAFPTDGFLGEEYGSTNPGADIRWIIDPIDGTKGYLRGLPFWGCMIAREVRGRLDVGVVHMPALRQTLWATRGGGAFLDGRRIRVSRTTSLRKSYILNGDLEAFAHRGALPRLGRIARSAGVVRSLGDCAAYRWVATGNAEAVIEAALHPWDVAAIKIIIEEAGGRVTDWAGRNDHMIRNIIASNGRLHGTLLRALRG